MDVGRVNDPSGLRHLCASAQFFFSKLCDSVVAWTPKLIKRDRYEAKWWIIKIRARPRVVASAAHFDPLCWTVIARYETGAWTHGMAGRCSRRVWRQQNHLEFLLCVSSIGIAGSICGEREQINNGVFKERILIYENLWFDEIIYQCHWNKESERCIMNPRAPKFREDLRKSDIYMPETMPRRDYRIVMTKLATPSPSKSVQIRQNITCTPLNWILHTFRAVHKGYHINRSNPHIQHVDNTRLSNVIMIFSSFLSMPLSGNTEAKHNAQRYPPTGITKIHEEKQFSEIRCSRLFVDDRIRPWNEWKQITKV